MIEIKWNGFLKDCIREFPKEICAWVFAENIYSDVEVWHVFRVKEIPMDWDKDGFAEGWKPDKKELTKLKSIARKSKLIEIGNVHTHPISKEYTERGFCDNVNDSKLASEKDLAMARRFHNIVRGIIVVEEKRIKLVRFHDQFDRTIYELTNLYFDRGNGEELEEGHYFNPYFYNEKTLKFENPIDKIIDKVEDQIFKEANEGEKK